MAERKNTGMRLLPETVERIDRASQRLGRSRAAVVDIVVALHADGLTAETLAPLGSIPNGSRARRKNLGKKKR